MIIRIVSLLMVSMSLLACSPDNAGKLPPERPFGTISGLVAAAPIANAEVTVYGFGGGSPGRRLGGTLTDDNGAYTVDIQAPSQIVLVEVRGGHYLETAGGNPVSLAQDQVLRAVGHYRSGHPLTLMVTPLTHMAVALAEFKIGNGMAPAQAVDEARAEIDRFFALDVSATRPVAISTTGASSPALGDDALYGFYLAGLSHWVRQAAPTGGLGTIALSQILYRDLRDDGLLDGRGLDRETAEPLPLDFAGVALDADSYRSAFSLHMLAMASSAGNRSGLGIADLSAAAHAIAAQTILLPEDTPPLAIDGRVTGKADTIAGAQVTVYGLGDTEGGRPLGSGQTDANGNFDITLHALDQPLLLELRGGRYVEAASDSAAVELAEGQVLRAVGRYRAGRTLNLMVTPLTQMIAALAEYKVANGMATAQAIDEAENTVNAFFALDVQATRPAAITPPDAVPADLANGLPADSLYSLYLAGLSHWALWAGQLTGTPQPPHLTWNTATLSQALYHDLRSDGLLDGRGLNPDATELVPLGFGTTPLSADTYRLAFSLHMLAFSQGPRNQSGIATGELLDTARALAAQTALVPQDATPAPLDAETPRLHLRQLKQVGEEETLLERDQFAGTPQNGAFLLQVSIGGLLGANRLTTTILDASGNAIEPPRENALRGLSEVLVIIDTGDYADGEYTITLTAENVLGGTTTESFTIQFDNTGPLVTVTSPPSTNQPTITLSGTFDDNIAGVAGITVAGQEATLFTDDTWRIEGIALEPGKNTLPISVVDRLGNRRDDFEAVIYRDESAPLIDSSGRHGQARFSDGAGGFTTARLQDENTTPLYFDTDRLELGTTLLSRSALDADGIPYFAFRVSDLTGPATPTDASDITVRMQYRRNEEILRPWQELTPVGDEYLVPLSSETLATDWHRASPLEPHVIDIEVTDPAGNRTTTRFGFHAEFHVPAFDISNDNGDASNYIDDLGADIFADTAFAERASLNNRSITTTGYTFRNTTGKAFYLSLNDDSLHTTTQVVDKLVREHRVRKKTTIEWRIGLMTPTDNCPDFDPSSDTWQYPTSVWNWNGSAWTEEQVPEPSYDAEENIFQDTPLPDSPPPSDWSDVPDFDDQFESGEAGNSSSRLTYLYDYILDRTSLLPEAGYILAWTFYPDILLPDVQLCPNKRYFQQRETYTYESVPGYPRGVLTTETIADTPDFITTGYTVMDNDTGTAITPVSGWYLIPAGHSVTIEKQVTTPALTLHNDDISSVDSFPSYSANRLDKTLTWSVDRHLGITLVHDAGEANIDLMPPRNMAVGSGTITYRISRD